MRILYIGCVESSKILLEILIRKSKDIVGVITKDSSDYNSDFTDLRPLCVKNNIPYHCVFNINDDDSIEFIQKYNPDIGYCFGWSQLLKEEVLSLFPRGVIGFHPAALPNNRGRHPIVWALALGLDKTASTFFRMNIDVDNGDIISQKEITIEYEDDARSLYDKVIDTAAIQVEDITEVLENADISGISQHIGQGNTWRKRNKADGEIDWRMSSRTIYNLVRALTRPYVGAHFVFKNHEYKVWKLKEIQYNGIDNIEPGKVLEVDVDESIVVRVSDGAVKLIDFDRISVSKGEYLI